MYSSPFDVCFSEQEEGELKTAHETKQKMLDEQQHEMPSAFSSLLLVRRLTHLVSSALCVSRWKTLREKRNAKLYNQVWLGAKSARF